MDRQSHAKLAAQINKNKKKAKDEPSDVRVVGEMNRANAKSEPVSHRIRVITSDAHYEWHNVLSTHLTVGEDREH